MKKIKILIIGIIGSLLISCDFLDIVPDNVATIDYAFRMRSTAEKYLSTCYSFLPQMGHVYSDIGMNGADELWYSTTYTSVVGAQIARGEQNVDSPIGDYWNGANSATDLWTAISQCNIFLENIESVPDMEEWEIKQWIAEVKFLKAYYHFFLLRNYGPIPVMKKNIPISASGDEVRVYRRPVDEVFEYIVELLDEAIVDLPEIVGDESTQLGRITLPIALGVKAKILVYAASPLFNGNADYKGFKNINESVDFFNSTYSKEKWQKAADALKSAIDKAHSLGYKLYDFEGSLLIKEISPELDQQMTLRNRLTERWNTEIIWANTNSTTRHLQQWSEPKALNESQRGYYGTSGNVGITMNMTDMFYSKNGVPIDEDITWDYNNRLNLKVGTENEKYYIKNGYTTAAYNFDREPRFYADLGFDGGIWFGNGNYDVKNPYWLEMKRGQFLGKYQAGAHAVTGYHMKKFVYYTNTKTTNSGYSSTDWPWVMLRLADLYLLYSEALNEIDGPSPEVFEYLDAIRDRAGLPGIQASWNTFSKTPSKYTTQSGLREIIHHERTIEMAFEGERFYDLRRWKEAPLELNEPILGWDVDQEFENAYYRPRILFNQTFSLKDYFWPLRERDLIVNKNLVQNPGW